MASALPRTDSILPNYVRFGAPRVGVLLAAVAGSTLFAGEVPAQGYKISGPLPRN